VMHKIASLTNERRKNDITGFEFRTGLVTGRRWSLNLEVHRYFPCTDSAFSPNVALGIGEPYL